MGAERFDTVVIGGGQAGLAMGHYLARQGREFLIVDAGTTIGQTWRERWDSLRLFTPAHFTRLPGLEFPAQRRHLPSKDDMADYLRSYQRRFDLPVRLGWRVEQLTRDGDGYLLRRGGQVVRADHVVLATGPAMRPYTPPFAAGLDARVQALHAAGYRNPAQLREGPVLVVGAGNSGAEIALDLVGRHRVLLAGRDTGRMPVAVGGPAYQIMNALLTSDSRAGRRFMGSGSRRGATPLVRVSRGELARAGVELLPRLRDVVDGRPRLDDGRVLDVPAVLWCTGYLQDYSWVELSGFPASRPPAHHRGVVHDHPGLYLLGLPFLHRMASSLVGGVGPDARFLGAHIARRGVRAPS
jgi:putative flavoprotein involved in K+ transport